MQKALPHCLRGKPGAVEKEQQRNGRLCRDAEKRQHHDRQGQNEGQDHRRHDSQDVSVQWKMSEHYPTCIADREKGYEPPTRKQTHA
jgi:hypothetical protein